jgi:deoxyadenosine/deoxycytidine kinase
LANGKIFIAVAGNIGTGKTSLTRMLSERFSWKAHFEAVVDNPYLADFYRDMARWSFPLQIYFLNNRFSAHQAVSRDSDSAIQDRSIIELQPIFDNPKYMFNPKKVGALIAKSRRLNPSELQYTEEEQRKIEETPPPPAPAVQVAQIKAEVEKMKIQTQANVEAAADASAERIAQMDAQATMEIEQLRQQTAQLRIKMDTDRDNVYVQTQLQNAQTIYQGKLQELQLKKEIAISEFAMQQQLSIDQAKTKLADTAMKLKVQKELAAVDAHVQLKKDTLKPPVQTPGRAKDSFSQM